MEQNIHEIVRILFEGVSAAPIGVLIKPNNTIIRSVYGHGHRMVKELSYRPVADCKEYQRASIPGETVFYGCMGEHIQNGEDWNNEIRRAMIMCAAESSPLLREGMCKEDAECRTLSQWNVKRSLKAICFITDETFAGRSSYDVDKFREIYKTKVPYISEEQRCWMRRISNEFTKQVHSAEEYEFTAKLCHYLLQEYKVNGKKIDAIIYPSVQTQGELGVNVAISKESADDALEFEHLFECVIEKIGKQVSITCPRQYNAQFRLKSV